jgi:hypothetical protein
MRRWVICGAMFIAGGSDEANAPGDGMNPTPRETLMTTVIYGVNDNEDRNDDDDHEPYPRAVPVSWARVVA